MSTTTEDFDHWIAEQLQIVKEVLPDIERVMNEAVAEGHKVPKKALADARKLGLNVPTES